MRNVLPEISKLKAANSAALVKAFVNLFETLAFGLKRAGDVGSLLLRGRSRAIWQRALTEGPPEALDVALASLSLPDKVAQEANIIWAPAAALAADPRPWVRLVGLTSRAWPRHQSEDALLPNHIVNSSLLDPLPVHQADRRDFDTILEDNSPTSRLLAGPARHARTCEWRFTPISEDAGGDISPARPDPRAGGWLD